MASRKVLTVGTVVVRWDSSSREYIARIPGNLAADYFTPDLDDAIGTARLMQRAVARQERV